MRFIWDGEPIAMSIPSALPPPAAPPPNPPPPQAARAGPLAAAEAEITRPVLREGRPTASSGDSQGLGGLPNPSIRMDPALGIVVLEFRDQRGAVRSIPTERELEAYRAAATRHERSGEKLVAEPAKDADRP